MHAGRSPAGASATSTSGIASPDPRLAQRAQALAPRSGTGPARRRRSTSRTSRRASCGPGRRGGCSRRRPRSTPSSCSAGRLSACRSSASRKAAGPARGPRARAHRVQLVEQPPAAAVEHLEDALEGLRRPSSRGPARPGRRRGSLELAHQPDAVAQRRRAARAAARAGGRGPCARIRSKRSKSASSHLARDRRDRHAARLSHAPRARVGRLALVVAVGARRVDLEVGAAARLLGLVPEDRLGQRRAADVAGAHEEQPHAGETPECRTRHDSAPRHGATAAPPRA